VTRRFAATALMLGNVVTGCSVLAPAGMLAELAEGLDVSIRSAGLLITFGAITLCVGSPVAAWLTSRIERRTLLVTTLAVLAVGNLASAMATSYPVLMAIRLIMLAIGALYTPQAAGTGAMIVPAEKRGSTIAYIFLGWSLAAAAGLPLITAIASRFGWQAAYGAIGAVGCLSVLLLGWRLPAGLRGAPIDLKTWGDLFRDPRIITLLVITTLLMSGQFTIFTFMGPLLKRLAGAGPDAIGFVFALYGTFGFLGIAIATRFVDTWGAWRTSLLFATCIAAGITGWALSGDSFALMAGSVAIWGLGFASSNSMQQVRLVAVAPTLATASVSLNTSVLYIGQAIGSAVGGVLYDRNWLHGIGFVAVGFAALALALVVRSRPRQRPVLGLEKRSSGG
jgi:MFS transporter, DHA1 family, inner membrane transport protein